MWCCMLLNPNTWETEAGISVQVPGQLDLQMDLQASQGCIKKWSKKKKTKGNVNKGNSELHKLLTFSYL